MQHRIGFTLWAIAALVLPSAGAHAFSIAHRIEALDSPAGGFELTGFGKISASSEVRGAWDLAEAFSSNAPGYEFRVSGWSTTFDIDPYVTNNLVVTNTSSSVQTFVATVLLQIPPYVYSTVVNSSVGLSVTDSNGDSNLRLENSGTTPIFVGSVNGTPILPLDPSSPGTLPITTSDCLGGPFPGCTAVSAINLLSLGVTPGIATEIGITLTFRLSPNDAATLTSRFEIVPEPGTGLLALSGLLGIGVLGRVRRPRA